MAVIILVVAGLVVAAVLMLVRGKKLQEREKGARRYELAKSYATLIRSALRERRLAELEEFSREFQRLGTEALVLLPEIYSLVESATDKGVLAWVADELAQCVARHPKQAKVIRPFIKRMLEVGMIEITLLSDAHAMNASRIIAAGGKTFAAFLPNLRVIMAVGHRDLDVREDARKVVNAIEQGASVRKPRTYA
jgi:hypothetical protein